MKEHASLKYFLLTMSLLFVLCFLFGCSGNRAVITTSCPLLGVNIENADVRLGADAYNSCFTNCTITFEKHGIKLVNCVVVDNNGKGIKIGESR